MTTELFKVCSNTADLLKQKSIDKIVKYNASLYNELLSEINDFVPIKEAIAKSMCLSHTSLTFLASYVHSGRGRLPGGSDIPLSSMHVWDGEDECNQYYDNKEKVEHTKDIFTTTKYGDIILYDLLQSKLSLPFRVKIIESIMRVNIEWGNIDKKKCIIL